MGRRFGLALLLLSMAHGTALLASGVDAAPKGIHPPLKALPVKPGNCAACHKARSPLPEGHVDTRDFTYKDCLGCHVAGEGAPGSLRIKIPGSHLHALNGVQCAQCHGNVQKYEPVPMNQCLSCHGDTKALAERTANVKPRNPHESRHYGTEADCNLCHHQHGKSQNHCAECHNFGFKVP